MRNPIVEGLYQEVSSSGSHVIGRTRSGREIYATLQHGDECPNCKSGTIEAGEDGEMVCRGECGAVFQPRKRQQKKGKR